jgi:hypothetical protein
LCARHQRWIDPRSAKSAGRRAAIRAASRAACRGGAFLSAKLTPEEAIGPAG